ncbi:MAG: hypothetical protein BWY52_03192 [Chloroflexi bacterium ADurb.Bin325]|nr:MAG: hypothetical protein BWY52_03192 [Chloroflexi bacterium ADurb.Bin325]
MDWTYCKPCQRNMPPIHATGSRCDLTRLRRARSVSGATRVKASITCAVATSQPAQPARPSGSPVPQTTMLTNGKTNGVRLVHWWPGG